VVSFSSPRSASPTPDHARLQSASSLLNRRLLSARNPAGHWTGNLASSALSTATATAALAVVEKNMAATAGSQVALIRRGLDWLAGHQNPDGGWGDTDRSQSNISTTTLAWAAFGAASAFASVAPSVVQRCENWLIHRTGGLQPDQLAPVIAARYGDDRTFSVPILTTCAVAGRFGPGPDAWRAVDALPFELAAFPHWCFAALRLPVVSYALPALIAMGQARHHYLPSRNPVTRWLRTRLRAFTLAKLERIQPNNGGFLEATPLTSFVTLSLAAAGYAHHSAVQKGVAFLVNSVRPDGSWPIDTNLATWVTTLAVAALRSPSSVSPRLVPDDKVKLTDWLLGQQHRSVHPYTNAAGGGWAWTDLPGGVPDADDTAGALVALRLLAGDRALEPSVIEAGVNWLLDLQNHDGGIPTFCRGWGRLEFDRSAPDLTAHSLQAWAVWMETVPAPCRQRVESGARRAIQFLARTQRPDGSWVPLWFGNEHSPSEENPVYGTARVLSAVQRIRGQWPVPSSLVSRGVEWLLAAQNGDGGWGGCHGAPSSVEETALALEALASEAEPIYQGLKSRRVMSLQNGVTWLLDRVETCDLGAAATPIGLYFARLWYYEQLYPLIFAAGALNRVCEANDGSDLGEPQAAP
jgi:squalene-hopene/tetraprenyl-beta-curcumene cyclase